MSTLHGRFAHIDSRGNTVDLYGADDYRVYIATAATTEGAAPAVLTELSYDAAIELHAALSELIVPSDLAASQTHGGHR